MVKQLQYRKGKGRATNATVDVQEFGFRPVRRIGGKSPKNTFVKYGYIVSMAAVFLPEADRVFWGASVCSPEDIYSGKRGSDQALGRARQNCIRFLKDDTSAGLTSHVITSGVAPSVTMEQLRDSDDFKAAVEVAVKGARAAHVRKRVLGLCIPLEEIAQMIAAEAVNA